MTTFLLVVIVILLLIIAGKMLDPEEQSYLTRLIIIFAAGYLIYEYGLGVLAVIFALGYEGFEIGKSFYYSPLGSAILESLILTPLIVWGVIYALNEIERLFRKLRTTDGRKEVLHLSFTGGKKFAVVFGLAALFVVAWIGLLGLVSIM